MTPEEKQRIEQIRERVQRLERAEKDPHVKTWDGAYYGDVHFLLSLVKSQEAELTQERYEKDDQVEQFKLEWAKRRELEQADERRPDPAVIGGAAIAHSLVKGDMPPVLWISTNSQSGRFEAHRHKLYNDDSRYLLGSQADESYTDALRGATKREQNAATSMRSACVEEMRRSLHDPSLRFSSEGIKAAITDWTNILMKRVESGWSQKPVIDAIENVLQEQEKS